MKLSLHAETIAQFLHEHKNEKGYCNLVVCERREADKYGNTHYIALDTWKPDASRTGSKPAPSNEPPPNNDSDDVPF